MVYEQFATKLFNKKGQSTTIRDYTVTSNPATNQLIVRCPTKEDIDSVLEFLELVDVPPIQVKIDCLISEVYADKTLDWETTLQIENLLGESIWAGPAGRPFGEGILQLVEESATIAAFPGASLRDLARAKMGLKVGYLSQSHKFLSLVDLLESQGYLKILMNPSLNVVNGRTAKVSSSQRVPVDKTYLHSPQAQFFTTKTEWADVVDSLNITPHVFADGYIGLETSIELGSKLTPEGIKQVSIVTKRQIENEENRIRPGESLIIGGLRKSERRDVVRGIPFLKDIPVLGILFSGRDFEERAVETLFILTPSISTGGIPKKEMMEEVERKQDRTSSGEQGDGKNPFDILGEKEQERKAWEAEEARMEAEAEKAEARAAVRDANDQAKRAEAEIEKAAKKAKEATAAKQQAITEVEKVKAEAKTATDKATAAEKQAQAEIAKLQAETEKLKAEAEKAKADAQKATAEVEKAKAEAQKATAEAEKAKADAQKATADATTSKAEAEKLVAEAEKAKADALTAKAEAEQLAAEGKKAKADAEKATADAATTKAEAERLAAEAEKAKADAEKAATEAKAIAKAEQGVTEKPKEEAEKLKDEAEKAKADAQKLMAEAEKAKLEAEAKAKAAEKAKAEADAKAKAAEDAKEAGKAEVEAKNPKQKGKAKSETKGNKAKNKNPKAKAENSKEAAKKARAKRDKAAAERRQKKKDKSPRRKPKRSKKR
jgi:hypothetical protein